MPRKRYVTEFICHDANLTACAPVTQLAFFRLLAVSDDFGFVPGSIHVLRKLCGFQEILRSWPRVLSELVEGDLVSPLLHDGQFYLFFNPESFDRIQNHIVNKRTQSEYLHLAKRDVEPLRVPPCDKKTILQEILRNTCTTNSKNFLPSRARKATSSSPLFSDSEQKKETPDMKMLPPDLSPENREENIPAEVVRIMHRVGHRTNLEAYQNISHTSWEPDLRQIGHEKGFACLLREALKFEQWFLGVFETDRVKAVGHGKPNPRTRFLHYWWTRVKPESYTTGDTETSWPDTKPSDQYRGLSV